TARPPQDAGQARDESGRSWLIALAVVAIGTGSAVQTWFKAGTAIGTGDIAPPYGIAWLSRIFAPWTWSGSDLGGPSQLQLQLPWAACLWLSDRLGGSPEVAQRVWYTALFMGT